MWAWIRSLFKRETFEEKLRNETEEAIRKTVRGWNTFNAQLHFKEDSEFAVRFAFFIHPIISVIREDHPILFAGPPAFVPTLITTAVLETKTHPATEINHAAELVWKFLGQTSPDDISSGAWLKDFSDFMESTRGGADTSDPLTDIARKIREMIDAGSL